MAVPEACVNRTKIQKSGDGMKHFYCISGTMGVGKTTTCQILKHKLDRSVFLDGDWCWDSHPFQVTEETKHMVIDNICYLLNNFIRCSAYDNIIFCWVMHQQAIIDRILTGLSLEQVQLHSISLICSEAALKDRLHRDVANGLRTDDVIERSTARLPLYDNLDTVKIDVSHISPEETAQKMIQIGLDANENGFF